MQKPRLSISNIWYLSLGFMGIQGGFALQNGNASRILANLGADVHQLSWFWLVAPLTGLLVQPVIGHYSDNTWTRLGRRKPFFLTGAICAVLGLLLLPNANNVIGDTGTTLLGLSLVLWGAGLFLAFMDASFNVAMEPFRALVGDMLPKSQRTYGFAIQTVLIGIGAVLGSFLPQLLTWYGVPNEAPAGSVAPNVLWSFYIGAALLLVTILLTILKTREYPPEEFARYNNIDIPEKRNFSAIFSDFAAMPMRMKRLGLVQFFAWFGFFSMWVFTTPAIATHHFGLSPGDTHSKLFNDAGDWVGILFGIYNGISAIYALIIHKFAHRTSRKFVHILSMTLGGLGLIVMQFISDPNMLWIPMIGVGLAWGSVLSIPYTLLVDKLPPAKMGVYMGIFNFFIVIPQLVNGVIGGYVVKAMFDNYAIHYISIAGVFFLLSALATLAIREPLWNENLSD